MVGHMLVMGKTGLYPSTLSRSFISDELRQRCDYKNVILTDEMGMRSVSYLYGKYNSIVKAFIAGNDIICCKYSDNFIEKIIDKVLDKVNKGLIKLKDIDNSVNRIENMKKKYNFSDEVNEKEIDIEGYNQIMDSLKKKVDNVQE